MAPRVCPPEEYGPENHLCQKKPSCPPGPGMLERSWRFSSQDGTQGGAAMESAPGFCWCGHIPRGRLPFTMCMHRKEEPRAHACALGALRENRGTRPQEASVPTHLTRMNWKGSSNTNLDTGGLSRERLLVALANPRHFSLL